MKDIDEGSTTAEPSSQREEYLRYRRMWDGDFTARRDGRDRAEDEHQPPRRETPDQRAARQTITAMYEDGHAASTTALRSWLDWELSPLESRYCWTCGKSRGWTLTAECEFANRKPMPEGVPCRCAGCTTTRQAVDHEVRAKGRPGLCCSDECRKERNRVMTAAKAKNRRREAKGLDPLPLPTRAEPKWTAKDWNRVEVMFFNWQVEQRRKAEWVEPTHWSRSSDPGPLQNLRGTAPHVRQRRV